MGASNSRPYNQRVYNSQHNPPPPPYEIVPKPRPTVDIKPEPEKKPNTTMATVDLRTMTVEEARDWILQVSLEGGQDEGRVRACVALWDHPGAFLYAARPEELMTIFRGIGLEGLRGSSAFIAYLMHRRKETEGFADVRPGY